MEEFIISEGELTYIGSGEYGALTYVWTFSATGYKDVVVSFDLSPSATFRTMDSNSLLQGK
ncbi:hypothetical protein SAMN04487944_11854 [Gracilibacillus ureilyticus]|uniref:Uncharacterized protein n=2 Tax=Gracilibacillus ureilyticus TaxID=531814 RepID=A0A1H9ULV9_9BACI|nr:hypothetical protein [Gracilibacillus ureilyticus]SES10445.1 hypothetical protein SAMN04487944_11854 [Gracilibacillus ureilyticus]